MKLATFVAGDDSARVGVLRDDGSCVDIKLAALLAEDVERVEFSDMLTLIETGPAALEAAALLVESAPMEAISQGDEIRLLAPLPRPPQLRDCLCFEKHLKQAFNAAISMAAATEPDPEKAALELRASGRFDVPKVWYKQPIYYKANRFAISGPDEVITWPSYSEVMDYELELAAVIGKRGKNIPKNKALSYVFGFTVFNDFSARDAQMVESQGMLGPAKGKDFDKANSFGPCIVTIDEIGDPYDLTMIARVNGEERCRGSSSDMYWKFEDLIAHISRDETLYPGELLGSGTVGDGCGLEHLKFLEDGDVIELEIEKIGVLRNTVIKAVKTR